MRLKTLALVCLLLPGSIFASSISVPPGAGGEGIQSALDSLPAGGGVVLAAGQYLIHQPIMLRKNGQTLSGLGASTILYLADGANCPVVIMGSFTTSAKSPTDGIRLADLVIDGNRKNQQKEVWKFLPEGSGIYNNGVNVWGAQNANVEGVVCSHCRSGGMVTSSRTRRLTVRDFTAFDNQFDGLACYMTEDSDFSHLNLHDNLAAGISMDLNFNHNVIHDALLTADDLGIFMRQSHNNIFEGVTIKQSRHHGVFMAETAVQTPAGPRLLPGSECTGNTFCNLSVTRCGGKAFLVNNAGCNHNVISGGQFSDNALGGLSQAAANLVTMQPSDDHAPETTTPAQPATPTALQLTEDAAPRLAHTDL